MKNNGLAMKIDSDPTRRAGVLPGMRPGLGTVLVAAALLTGCGGKEKQAPENPEGSTGTVTTLPQPGTPGAGGVDDAGQPGQNGGDTAPASGQPAVAPPGVDLPPEERQRRLAEHLGRAKKALSGSKKDPDVAISEARAALQVDERSIDAMLHLAHANYLKGYLDLAEDVLDKAEKRGGAQRKELHFLRGLVFERTERQAEAMASFERAVALDPNYTSGLVNLGGHLLKNKRYNEAVSLYERLTGELGRNTTIAWNNLASAYRGRSAEVAASDPSGRNQLLLKAEATYKRAIALNKKYSPAYYNLGLLFLDSDPYPTGNGGDMDKLKRLKRARGYFDKYRTLPGANVDLADEQAALAQKLYDREKKVRKKLRDAERRRKEAERRAKELGNSDGGFE